MTGSVTNSVQSQRYRRRRQGMSRMFALLCASTTVLCVLIVLALLATVLYHGISWLSWHLLTDFPSRFPLKAGIKAALVSSLWLIGLTALFSVPIGVGTAVFLEEYASTSFLKRWVWLIQLNIANLAGVPSIVYGLLGLAVFVRALALERSVLSGALTLTLVVLPIVILAAQEALRAVPGWIRQASYALGATRWQTVWHQVLPAATPGIMTGVILAVSRALGEAAPLVAVGAATFMTFTPTTPMDEFSALPVQIFYWAGHAKADFHDLAAAAIIVLLTVLIAINLGAILIRYRFGRHNRW